MRLVNRRRVYAKRMIPIEYLEADNPYALDSAVAAYVNCINTGYIPKSNNVRINTKIMWKDYDYTWNTDWFGGYSFVDNKMYGIGVGSVYGNKTSLTINYNNYNQRNVYSVEQGSIYEIYLRSDMCFINGQYIPVAPPVTDGSENTAPIYLFRSSMTGSSGYASGFQGRFYYFQIYEGEQLVMDLRPVRISTTGFMYDKVSGKLFKNEATKGEFILGPDIPDIPDIPVPDFHYYKVEYLESTGTQWIDTGIKFDTTKHGLFVDGIFINDLSGTRTISGCWEGGFDINHLSCGIGGNYENCYFSLPILSGFRGGSAGKKIAEPGVRNMVGFINHGIENDVLKATQYVNGVETEVTVNNPYVGISAQTYPLGGVKGSGQNSVTELTHFLWYGFKFYEYDNLIMDLIPVRIGTNGFMYDKVSGRFFGNQGTGQFILGPDIE